VSDKPYSVAADNRHYDVWLLIFDKTTSLMTRVYSFSFPIVISGFLNFWISGFLYHIVCGVLSPIFSFPITINAVAASRAVFIKSVASFASGSSYTFSL